MRSLGLVAAKLPRKLRTRLVVIVVVAFATLGLVVDRYVNQRLEQAYDRSARATVTAIATTFSNDFEERLLERPSGLEQRVGRLREMNATIRELSVYVAAGGGRRLVTTNAGGLSEPVGASDIEPIRTGRSTYQEELEGASHFGELIFPLREPGRRPVASLGVYYDLAPLDAALARDRRFVAVLMAGVALFVAFTLLAFLRVAILGPLGQLATAARQIGAGHSGVRLGWRRTDELGEVAFEFDGMAEDLERTHERLEALASTDPLTGLLNHRTFRERLDVELARATRDGGTLSVLALDVDNLKAINDTHGDAAGDETLRGVAVTIEGELRPGDVCGRVGGDEFAVVLAGAGATGAEAIAERLRATVGSLRLGNGAATTLSIGLASFPSHSSGADQLLDLADGAMHWSKRDGRDRVTASSTRTGSSPSPELIEARVRSGALAQTVHALASAVDAKDGYTHDHSRRVSEYAEALALALDAFDDDEVDALRRAAILHDVGKIGIADAILGKPGRLTAAEFTDVQRHSDLGADIIAGAGMEREGLWVRHLHERWDGRGYPAGLEGADIPLPSRILHAADMLEAMTSSRVYRPGQPLEFALFEIEANAGTQLDPTVAGTLAELLRSERLSVPARAAVVPV